MFNRRVNTDKPRLDLELVEKNASVIFRIDNDEVIEVSNEDSRMTILGVTGECLGERYQGPAVLMEVGMARAKPYGEIPIPKTMRKSGEPKNFPKRLDCMNISDEQYLKVAPKIFQYLHSRAQAQVSARDCNWNNPYILSHGKKVGGERPRLTKSYFVRSKRYVIERETVRIPDPQVRFSVSLSDQQIVNDIYWAELKGNLKVKQMMKGLNRYLSLHLNGFKLFNRQTYPKDWRRYPRFYAAFCAIQDRFDGFEYRKRYFLENVYGKNSYFFPEFAEYCGWDLYYPTFELEAVKNALPDPATRLGGIQIKVVRRTKKHVIFDVFPEAPSEIIPF